MNMGMEVAGAFFAIGVLFVFFSAGLFGLIDFIRRTLG
jgi:hypothetical protein